MSKPYKFEYCMICHRQLIVRNVDGWTGKELPNDAPYVCDDCKRKQENKRRENVSEYEKQCALMFANYATQSKCKRNGVLPCEICRAVHSDCNVLPCEICRANYSD